jgi:membrane-bound lytic murein transglycosylase D
VIPGAPPAPALSVRTEDGRRFRLARTFHIGREQSCEVRIEDGRVSRTHAVVSFEDGRWVLRDRQSGNGIWVDGRRVESVAIDASMSVALGPDGPHLTLEIEPAGRSAPPRPAGETMILAGVADRYFGSGSDDSEPAGPQTRMIRKAFHRVQTRQRRTYMAILAAAAIIVVAALGYAYYGHRQMTRQKALAETLFYDMKALDVDIANLERIVATSDNVQGREQVQRYLERRKQMENTYEQFLSGLNVYNRTLTPQEQLILRVTRMFGECEMAAPPEYVAEVSSYIRRWQTTQRFAKAVAKAQEMGYTRRIAEEFQAQNLPPQFLYLAMQESDFNEVASGPPTRMGIAKGMWQFIPDTGKRFGLTIGPLAAYARPDPADDRHKWDKATNAAARYIKEIYSTDAQASGLLVMASYNWGENRVINMVRSMPLNPRERNFWKLLERYRDRVPKETYDYVLSIVSAAVIGENPRLFGFGFDDPLAGIKN